MRSLIVVAIVAGFTASAAPARAGDDLAVLDAIHRDIKEALVREHVRPKPLQLAKQSANLGADIEDELRAGRRVPKERFAELGRAVRAFEVAAGGAAPDAVAAMQRWSSQLANLESKLEFARAQQAEAEAARVEAARVEKLRRESAEQDRAEREARASTAITHRFPQFTSADAMDPAKVAAAFALAPDEMIFTVTGVKGNDWTFDPTFDLTGDVHPCDVSNGDAPHAVEVQWWHNGQSSAASVAGPAAALHDGEPVLIWERDGYAGLVVTADGARWRTQRLDKLARAALPVTAVPRSIAGPCLDDEQITELEKLGLVAAGTSARIAAVRAQAETCADRVWHAAQPQFDANDAANITASTVVATCNAPRKKLEAALAAVVAERVRQRTQALATITARLQRAAQDLTAPAAPSPPTPSTPPSP